MVRVKEKSEKTGLKLNIKKMTKMTTKIIALTPITLSQIEWEDLETVPDFIS